MNQDLLTRLWTASVPPELSPRQWERLLSQARRARLTGRLATWYQDHGGLEQVPDGPRRHLESALREVHRLQDQTRWEADCLRRALAGLPTPLVFLKGAAYVLAGLPPARGRLFVDTDLLVDRRSLREVELALFAAGWIAKQLDPYDERYYRNLMHELPPLQHVERGTALDVHHTITPPTSRFRVQADTLIDAAVPVSGVSGLHVLAPADMVIHSAVHLMQDGDFSGGLRDLLDITDLIQCFEQDTAFWPRLMDRAGELGLGEPLNDVLQQAKALTGLALPPEAEAACRRLAPRALRNRWIGRLLSVALRPDHPDCDGRDTALCRWLLYVRSHWLRMAWYQILPHLARKAWLRLHRRFTTAPAAPLMGLRP